jgi:alginate O-acetyltransferase complex protein AlgI
MLFNSYVFLLAFLPVSLIAYQGLRRLGSERGSIASLVLLSLFFYGWWNRVYLLLIVPQMLATFLIARLVMPQSGRHRAGARGLLAGGIAGNLALLGYFKYANFFVDNVNGAFGSGLSLAPIVLPLGISFITFQKIALLVDAYRGKIDRLELLDFSLFVTFFPQLIAGPIVHHSEVLPQFRQFRQQGATAQGWVAAGVTILTIGLAKKVLLADSVAPFVAPGFDAAAHGSPVGPLAAWSSALAYTAQLYFDFSGYSDMAIGAALLFGIRLPLNFNSPYRAASIIEFWRRWHMTLSRFLRDYLYFALGGNRHGPIRRYASLLATMLLGGLWHGAGWTFVAWGGLHGIYLCINHAWRAVRPGLAWLPDATGSIETALARALTLAAVVLAWVFFRAADLNSALVFLHGMVGAGAAATPADAPAFEGLALAAGLLLAANCLPNTQQLVGYRGPAPVEPEPVPRPSRLRWQPTAASAVATGAVLGVAMLGLSRVSEFLYFQF